MTFDKFKDVITDKIIEYLPEDYKDAEITIRTVEKSTHSYNGMTIRKPNEMIAPTINLDDAYEHFQQYNDLEMVLNDIVDMVTMTLPASVVSLADNISDYKNVKNKLFVMLHEYKGREDYYKTLIHRKIEDMVATYQILIDENSAVALTKDLFESYNVTEEQLYKDAIKNSAKKQPPVVQDLGSMFGNSNVGRVSILSNKSGVYGASAMLYPEVLDNISAGKPVYVLPSSIHEVLIHHDMSTDVNHLYNVVKSANETVVSKEEKLSDHVYKYENGKLSIAV